MNRNFKFPPPVLLSLIMLIIFASLARPSLPVRVQEADKAGEVVFAGVRSSPYGIKLLPSVEEWLNAMAAMTGYFKGSSPCVIWIVGQTTKDHRDTYLLFPADEIQYPHIKFDAVDIHEPYLTAFDKAGIRVFLQVEPADADVETLIDLVLGRYKHHSCVVGFGVDVEWNKVADKPGTGTEVDDATAQRWEAKVKSYNPEFRLFLKHWNIMWMPKTYRGDIIFVDDSQIFKSLDEMVSEFTSGWAPAFYPNTVLFQIGYGTDKPWWSTLPTPPKTIGEAIRKGVKQDMGIIWVDFSLGDVIPGTKPES